MIITHSIINVAQKAVSKQYKQLDACNRRQVSQWLKQGVSLAEIARRLGVHRSTISREVRRGRSVSKTGAYSWRKAQRDRQAKRHLVNQMHRKLIPGGQLETQITANIKEYWSPDQIIGYYGLDISAVVFTTGTTLSPETANLN